MGITRVQHPDLPPPATGQDVPQHKVRCSSIRPCRGGMNIPGVNAPGLVAPSLHHSTFHRAWGVSCRATAQPAAKRPDLPAAGGCARLASVLLIMAFPPVNRPWRSLALAHLSAGVSAGHAPMPSWSPRLTGPATSRPRHTVRGHPHGRSSPHSTQMCSSLPA